MRLIISLAFLLCVIRVHAYTYYTGTIDKYPVEFATNIYSDGDARAIYDYKNVHTPIKINGRLKDKVLTLYERDKLDSNTAILIFPGFNDKAEQVNGTWTDLKTKKTLAITLHRDFEIAYGDDTIGRSWEVIQSTSLKDYYFKLLVSKEMGESGAKTTGIKIINKKTDELLQQLNFEGEFRELDCVSIGDFNFDGYKDFSVFEQSYAGANTSELYFLYDPKTKKYFQSSFSGTSLDFDEKSKTVFETNECCMGTISTTARYKVVNNKMVLKEEHCYIWDEKKQDMVEHKMKDCQ